MIGRLVAGLVFVAPSIAGAEGFDFYLSFSDCKTVAAYVDGRTRRVLTSDGEDTIMACARSGKSARCVLRIGSGSDAQARSVEYAIDLDAPPYLFLMGANGGDFIEIHTSNHVAAISTRIVGETFLAAKVCSGLYMTDSEYEASSRGEKDRARK